FTLEIVAQRFVRAPEREAVPGYFGWREQSDFERLVVHAELAAKRGRGEHDDDRRTSGVGVDVDETVDANLEPRLLARFAHGGRGDLFAAIDVAARKHPQPVPGFDRAPHQHDPLVVDADDRTDRDLGVEVED